MGKEFDSKIKSDIAISEINLSYRIAVADLVSKYFGKEKGNRPLPDVEKIISYVNNCLQKNGYKTVNEPLIKRGGSEKISKIKNIVNNYDRDLIWMKFTTDKFLGCVAFSKGTTTNKDVNFKMNNKSGKIINSCRKFWDTSFILCFPLIPKNENAVPSKQMEYKVGECLISENVPILDYFSHYPSVSAKVQSYICQGKNKITDFY